MTYNDKVVRQFVVMTVIWGIVGMLVGVIIAAQLWLPALNFDLPWLTYSRLRPLHTNAVIFAFGGCALMGTSLYVVQRTCHVTLFAPKLASFVFWGWQLVILLAACVWSTPAQGEPLIVVVHPERETTLDLGELAQIYLRKRRFWRDGAPIVPVNREAGNRLRAAFGDGE